MIGRYDVIVVGGGTSGCVVAARAARAGLRTLVIEAGPDYGPRAGGAWPRDLLEPLKIPTSHDWGLQSHTREGRTLDHPTARVIGGCSSHNHCAALWGSRSFYDRWAAETDDAWSAAAMEPWLRQAEAALRTAPVAPGDLGVFGATFLEACAAHLGSTLRDAGGFCTPSLGAFRTNIHAGERFNTAFAYLDAVRGSDHLTVWPGAMVERLVVSDGAPAHVEVRSGSSRCRVPAKALILCAGAYQTPALLLRSGIGPGADLAVLGIVSHRDLGMVGKGLQDHPAVSLRYEMTPRGVARVHAEAHRGLSPWQTYAKLRSSRCPSTSTYDIQLYPYHQLDSSGLLSLTFPVACMTPHSTGTVGISAASGDAAPVIDHSFLTDESGHDIAVLAEGAAHIQAMVSDGPLTGFVGPELDGGPSGSGMDMQSWIRANASHYYHPTSSCRMGADPTTSVVDSQGRLHGIEGVFVADASVFPRVPDANTHVPVVATASRLAEAIVTGI